MFKNAFKSHKNEFFKTHLFKNVLVSKEAGSQLNIPKENAIWLVQVTASCPP